MIIIVYEDCIRVSYYTPMNYYADESVNQIYLIDENLRHGLLLEKYILFKQIDSLY